MKKNIFFILMAAVVLVAQTSSYAQDSSQEEETKTISGYVKVKDWVSDTLIINTGLDEMTFVVPNGTKITKGSHDSSLSEININDYVIIEYTDMRLAGWKAIKITIRSS